MDPYIELWQKKEVLLILNCDTKYLPELLGLAFPHLTTLVVWFSGLVTVYINNFREMPRLTEISLQDNLIETIEINAFYLVPKLTKLSLAGNRIKVLHEFGLEANKALQHFVANRNQIEYLQAGLFANTSALVYINVNNNKIKAIAVDFTKLKKLQKVLGLDNVCANFFLNKVVDAKQLNELVKANCSEPIPK